MSCPTHETLIHMHDGELSSRQRAALEPHLRSCQSCRAVLDGLAMQRALTCEAIDAELDAVSLDGFSQGVMRALDTERPVALRERLRLWLEEFLEHRRHVWVPAVACAIVLVVAGGVWEMQPAAPQPELAGSSVVSISAGAASAIVFDIPSEDGLSSTAVVWVNDESASDGGSGT